MELPVSGIQIAFRSPCGSDDVVLVEAPGNDIERGLTALSRLAALVDSSMDRGEQAVEWRSLTVTDFECALLGLRQFLLGDEVMCLLRSNSHDCGERMELSFSIAALKEEATPRPVRNVVAAPGVASAFDLLTSGRHVRFRLPRVEDQLAVLGKKDSAKTLSGRCIEGKVTKRELDRVESAMEKLSPTVSRPLEGNCPSCGKTVAATLHVPRLVMEELRQAASGVYREMDLIAAEYHWDEAAILAMPQQRRRAYVKTIRERKGN